MSVPRIALPLAPVVVFHWIWALSIFIDGVYRLQPLAIDTALPVPSGLWFLWLPAYIQTMPLAFLTLAGAVVLLLYPQKTALFWLVSILWMVDALIQMPLKSNHNLMMLWTTAGMAVAFLVVAVQQRRVDFASDAWFPLFVPMGRMMLVLMYVFGIFHKINTDFLNPESSCAVVLWRHFDFLPAFIRESVFWHQVSIVATFVLEGAMLLLLFFRGWPRAVAIVLGLGFHGFIALNSYQFYTAFTMLSFALHSLFLPPQALQAVMAAPLPVFVSKGHGLRLLVLLWAGVFLVARLWAWYSVTQVLFLLLTVLFMVLVVRYALCTPKAVTVIQKGDDGRMLPASMILNGLLVAFFLNCLMPYLGGKTGQALAMFSNLHTEGGRTNHLLFRKPPYLWAFQKHLVTIIDSNSSYLLQHKKRNVQMMRYALQTYLFYAPSSTTVTFEENGVRVVIANPDDHPEYRVPRPFWLHWYLVFSEVDSQQPRRCSPIDEEVFANRIVISGAQQPAASQKVLP